MDFIKQLILKDKKLPATPEAQAPSRVYPPAASAESVKPDLARRSYNVVARAHNNLSRPFAAKGGGSRLMMPMLPKYIMNAQKTPEQIQQLDDAAFAEAYRRERELMMMPDGIAKDFIPVSPEYENERRRAEADATGKTYRPVDASELHDDSLFGLDTMAAERAYLRGEERMMPEAMLRLLEGIQRQNANEPYRAPSADEELQRFDTVVDLPPMTITAPKRNKK